MKTYIDRDSPVTLAWEETAHFKGGLREFDFTNTAENGEFYRARDKSMFIEGSKTVLVYDHDNWYIQSYVVPGVVVPRVVPTDGIYAFDDDLGF